MVASDPALGTRRKRFDIGVDQVMRAIPKITKPFESGDRVVVTDERNSSLYGWVGEVISSGRAHTTVDFSDGGLDQAELKTRDLRLADELDETVWKTHIERHTGEMPALLDSEPDDELIITRARSIIAAITHDVRIYGDFHWMSEKALHDCLCEQRYAELIRDLTPRQIGETLARVLNSHPKRAEPTVRALLKWASEKLSGYEEILGSDIRLMAISGDPLAIRSLANCYGD